MDGTTDITSGIEELQRSPYDSIPMVVFLVLLRPTTHELAINW